MDTKKSVKQITLADLAKVVGGKGSVEGGGGVWETSPSSDPNSPLTKSGGGGAIKA
jgi:hypothetical protein